jgi:hypothetical protein
LNDSGAVGVHEWCEIRLIRVKGRLALCEESGRIWHSWAPFWLLFGEAKSDKKDSRQLRSNQRKKNNNNHELTSSRVWGATPRKNN